MARRSHNTRRIGKQVPLPPGAPPESVSAWETVLPDGSVHLTLRGAKGHVLPGQSLPGAGKPVDLNRMPLCQRLNERDVIRALGDLQRRRGRAQEIERLRAQVVIAPNGLKLGELEAAAYWKDRADQLEQENMELRAGAPIADPVLPDDPDLVKRYLAAGGHKSGLSVVEWWRRGEPVLWVKDLPVDADTVGNLKKQREQARAQARYWRRKAQGLEDPEDREEFERLAAENKRLAAALHDALAKANYWRSALERLLDAQGAL